MAPPYPYAGPYGPAPFQAGPPLLGPEAREAGGWLVWGAVASLVVAAAGIGFGLYILSLAQFVSQFGWIGSSIGGYVGMASLCCLVPSFLVVALSMLTIQGGTRASRGAQKAGWVAPVTLVILDLLMVLGLGGVAQLPTVLSVAMGLAALVGLAAVILLGIGLWKNIAPSSVMPAYSGMPHYGPGGPIGPVPPQGPYAQAGAPPWVGPPPAYGPAPGAPAQPIGWEVDPYGSPPPDIPPAPAWPPPPGGLPPPRQ